MSRFICFDDIIFNLQRFGGASTYWSELTQRVDSMLPGQTEHVTGRRHQRLAKPSTTARLFHSSHFRLTGSKRTINVATIHDLTYERNIIKGIGKYLNIYERYRCIRDCDAIICVSESTKNDLLDIYGKYVKNKPLAVIHHGATVSTSVAEPLDESRDQGLHPGTVPYFLYVGARPTYKNFDRLVLSLKQVIAHGFECQLICTGSPFNEHEMAFLQAQGLHDKVKVQPYLSPEQIHKLYQSAIALVYPSTYEGFGMPALDAMTLGCPVIASNSSSLPEVIGNAGILCDPKSTEDFVEAMIKLMDHQFRQTLIGKGLQQAKAFSWEKSVSMHMDFYNSIL